MSLLSDLSPPEILLLVWMMQTRPFFSTSRGDMVKPKIKDRYLFQILHFWHRLVNIKITPKIKSVRHNIYTRFNKWHITCVRSAEIACNYPCIIQRLNWDTTNWLLCFLDKVGRWYLTASLFKKYPPSIKIFFHHTILAVLALINPVYLLSTDETNGAGILVIIKRHFDDYIHKNHLSKCDNTQVDIYFIFPV